jgi:hypothetical protein
MLRYSFKTLDKLEEVEERKQHKAKAYTYLASPSATNPRGVASKHNYLLALSPRFFN